MASEILTIRGLSYSYPGASAPALRDLSCEVAAGECVCLTGESGCGKSTLLLAIKGALRGGRRSGSIELAVPEQAGTSPVGLVFQNAETQILCSTVADEVAFGPENLCVEPAEIARRVKQALQDVGLERYASRSVERFSAGQKQRLTIASVLSMNPSLLLLDEPTSQLDRKGKLELRDLLARLKRQGYTIIFSEHDTLPFAGIVDRYLTMEAGRIVSSGAAATGAVISLASRKQRNAAATTPSRADDGSFALSARGVTLSYPETGAVLRGVDLQLAQGERVHICGDNGAGKSSLLRCLAGLERPDAGSIEIAGVGKPRLEKLPGQVGMLFQDPARQLFAESVRDEVGFSLQRLRFPREERERKLSEALEFCNISHLGFRPPLTLSFGEQHRVALAAVLAPQPRLLLLDEPFAGLDLPQRRSLLALLAALPEKFGTTVLIATHDDLPDKGWADSFFTMDGGRLDHVTQ